MVGTINYFTDCFYLWCVCKCCQEDCVSTMFKRWCESRDIDCGYDIILRKNVCSCKRHSSSLRVLLLAIRFALSWPCDSLLWVLITIIIMEVWSFLPNDITQNPSLTFSFQHFGSICKAYPSPKMSWDFNPKPFQKVAIKF